MELLSFSEKQVDYIVTESKNGLKDHFKEFKNTTRGRKTTRESRTEKFTTWKRNGWNDEVDADFYPKWQKILVAEKAVIEANIEEMKKDRIDKFQSLVKDLHHLTNLKMIY